MRRRYLDGSMWIIPGCVVDYVDLPDDRDFTIYKLDFYRITDDQFDRLICGKTHRDP